MLEAMKDPLFFKIFTFGLAALLLIGLHFLLRRVATSSVHDNILRYKLRKMISLFTGVSLLLLVIMVFSERITGLSVALGVGGAGIAFALQEVIASFAGWVAVSTGNFYKIGDRVMLGGITGDVIDISGLRTTLMETGQWVKSDQYTGRIVRVSNAFVFKEPVFNYSGDFPFLWDEITIPIKYGSDRARARAILEKSGMELLNEYSEKVRDSWANIVRRYVIEDAVLTPTVTMTANDNWIEFTLRYVVDFKKRRATKDKLFSRILDEIDNSGGVVSVASTTLHIAQMPEVSVTVKD